MPWITTPTLSKNNNASVELHDVLKNSYKPKENAFKNQGYQFDKDLSNHNQQVYYNPNNKKLLFSVAGTHNLSDWGTDTWLALGGLKNTNRYTEAKKTLNKAKEKYQPTETSISGHSLGGSIAQGIASKDDKVYALDSGYTIGQKTRSHGGNFQHFRTAGDAVSLLSEGAKNMRTLQNPNNNTGLLALDAYKAHDVGNIKNNKILI